MEGGKQKEKKPEKMKEEILDTVVYRDKKKLKDEEIDEIYIRKNKVPLIPFNFELKTEVEKLELEIQENKEKPKEEQSEQEKQDFKKKESDDNEDKEQEENEEEEEEEDEDEEEEDEFDEEFTLKTIQILKEYQGQVIIDTEEKLIKLINNILKRSAANIERVIGIDTEQSFKLTYTPFLSLIQIATLQGNYIVDCLKIGVKGIKLLKYVFENKNIIKVFFAGQNDLIWLKRDYQLQVYNYCDVQKLSELVYGKKKDTSLVALWEQVCGYTMTKENKKILQVSEWSQRPLTKEQLEYACLDAHYLTYLRYYLIRNLLENDGIEFVVDELYNMQNQILKPYEQKVFNEKAYLALAFKMIKTNKNYQLVKHETQELAKIFLVELGKMREEIAQKNNINLGLLCSDKDLQLITAQLLFLEGGDDKENPNHTVFLKNQEQIEKLKLWVDHKEQILELTKKVTKIEKDHYLSKLNSGLLRQEKKEKERKLLKEKLSKRAVCKQKPYENCQLLSPSGMPLCNCNKKKIEWYKSHGLGEIVCENPLTLKLNFQPSGKNNEELQQELDLEDGYYTTHRENQCVVCGSKENFLKFHIVPPLYRSHFPNKFKSHRSHDILLFCFNCHKIVNNVTDIKKQEIAERYNIPINMQKPNVTARKKIEYFYKLGHSFANYGEKMEKDQKRKQKQNLRRTYKELLEKEEIKKDPEFLTEDKFDYNQKSEIKINKKFLDFCISTKKYLDLFKDEKVPRNLRNIHGQKVIEQLKSDDELIEFIKEWRQFFLEQMQPKFLPPSWSIDHKFCRGFGQHSVFKENSTKQERPKKEQEEKKEN